MGRATSDRPSRSPRRRERAPLAVAAGVFRRRDRDLFRAEGRAAAVAGGCRYDCRRRLELCAAPASGVVRGRTGTDRLCRRVCINMRDRPSASGPDVAALHWAADPHRTGRRHRLGAEGLARRGRAGSYSWARQHQSAARLRLHIPQTSDELNPGDHVRLKAVLHPVPPQILPGGRDFQRELYFAEIGAVGYTFGGARRITGAEGAPEASGGWREPLRHLRTEMTRRINAVLPGSAGGVASALITGKRGAIAEEVKQSFRDSGLSHLLAIAGLHLGLVGAFVFFAVRGGLALIPPIALRYPIKKIAAGVTLVALTCYLLISGAAIPTERAFVMNGIVFAAILIDRLRISMRICAIAA